MTKKQQGALALAFGVSFLVVTLALALLVPDPTSFQQFVFRIVLGLSSAGVAATIPGALDLKIGAGIRATGAIAVFALLYFFNPAELVTGFKNGPPGETFELQVKREPENAADILVNPRPDSKGAYPKGTRVRVDVLAGEGWAIAKWVGPVESVEGETGHVNMTGNLTILVRLEKASNRTPIAAVPTSTSPPATTVATTKVAASPVVVPTSTSPPATTVATTRVAASPVVVPAERPDQITGFLTYRGAGLEGAVVA
ncbi:MAG: hypothetical protein HY678_09345, partial [Chloroflexi bacterium]|nr:hypothetical protein [Chloroflexota bacterium]